MKLELEVEQSCCAVHVDLRDLAHPCQRQRHHRQCLPHLQQQPIYWSQLTMAPQMMQCCPPLMPRYSEIQEKTITTKLGCHSYIPSLCPRGRRSDHLPVLLRRVVTEPLRRHNMSYKL